MGTDQEGFLRKVSWKLRSRRMKGFNSFDIQRLHCMKNAMNSSVWMVQRQFLSRRWTMITAIAKMVLTSQVPATLGSARYFSIFRNIRLQQWSISLSKLWLSFIRHSGKSRKWSNLWLLRWKWRVGQWSWMSQRLPRAGNTGTFILLDVSDITNYFRLEKI